MKIVIAPDKFKGSLTALQFCDAVEEGVLQALPKANILKLPLADGGDGTIEILRYHLKGKRITSKVSDPLFRPIKATYLYVNAIETAFIEMAEASGMNLLKREERNCFHTTTLGTGELILDAINKGAKTIIIGIGGSATNDCGIGMATALGYQFLDKNDKKVLPIGKNMSEIHKIKTTNVIDELKNVTFKVAYDVANPLYGPNGAAFVYGPQKGASKEEIIALDNGLKHMANIFKNEHKINVQKIEGTGAAGGIGSGAMTFLHANLVSGIELVKDLIEFDTQIKDSDWIITGEGKLDSQTLSGKTIEGVINSAKKQHIPVAALCGSVDLSIKNQEKLGLTYTNAIVKNPTSLEKAMEFAYDNLVFSAFNFARMIEE